MVEHRTQFSFKGKREHIAMANMPNITNSNQHIEIEIHVIVLDTVEITFNLDIKSKGKTSSIVNNVDRALVNKKVLMLLSKDTDTINNLDVYDIYKDLYLSEKEHEENLLQVIQSPNCLKARLGVKTQMTQH